MVVEDEEDMRDLIRFALRKDPQLEVIGEASTAEEAVDIARETRPDVVILDHFLEGETRGLDIAPDLKEAAPDTKIVLFSSHDLSTEASREPAVDLFLRKSDIQQLLPRVRDLLGRAS